MSAPASPVSSGGETRDTLWRILPAFTAGWILAFFGILRELSASILLYTADTEVLSVMMLKMWSSGRAEEVSVVALFMLAMVLVLRGLQLGLARKERT